MAGRQVRLAYSLPRMFRCGLGWAAQTSSRHSCCACCFCCLLFLLLLLLLPAAALRTFLLHQVALRLFRLAPQQHLAVVSAAGQVVTCARAPSNKR